MKKIILVIVASIILSAAFAQDKPELVTDRPDQTEAPSLVPRGGVQVETGFQFETDKEGGVKTQNYTYNTTLLKYGINEHLELRLINEYLGTSIDASGELRDVKISGLSPLALGVKLKLADEKGFWPQAAFIGHINFKTGAKAYQPEYTAVDFRFTFAHGLTDKLALSYNLGAEWDGGTPDATFLYTLSLGYKFNRILGAYIEGYSFFPENSKADNRVDAGITVLITPMVQWDMSAGVGLSSNSPDSFVSTGLSFRLFK